MFFHSSQRNMKWRCGFMLSRGVWLQDSRLLRPFKTLVFGRRLSSFQHTRRLTLRSTPRKRNHTSIAATLNMTIHLLFWRVFYRVYVAVAVLRIIMLDGWTNEVQFGFLPVTGAQRWVSLHGNFVSDCPRCKVSFPRTRAVKHTS